MRLAAALAAIPVLTHNLGLARYGVWVVLVSLLGLTSVLHLGLGPAISFHVAQARGDSRVCAEVLGTSLVLLGGLGLVAGAVLALGAQQIVAVLFGSGTGSDEARAALPWLGCAAWLQFLRQWAASAEAGLQRYDVQTYADGVGALFLHGGLMVLAALRFDVVALAAWSVVATFGTLAVHARLWRTRIGLAIPTPTVWSAPRARVLLHFGVRQWGSHLGGSLFGLLDRVVVNWIMGPAAAGLYSIATAVAVRINELSAAPVQVIVPAIAEARSPSRMMHIYERAEQLNMLVAYGLAAAVMVGSEPLAHLLVPAGADTVAALLRIVALSYGAYSINAVGFYAAQGLGRPSINAGWMLLVGLLFLVVLPLSTELFGLVGAGWTNLTFALTLGINVQVVRRLKGAVLPVIARQARFLLALTAFFLTTSHLMPAMPSAAARVVVAGVLLACSARWILRSTGGWRQASTAFPLEVPSTHAAEV